jgi:alginate O-acetyltransferase complex protein AlgI
MVFSSYTFLFAFLPIVIGCYYLVPNACKNYVALLASLLFYAWGAPFIVPLLALACVADLLLSNQFESKWRKPAFILSILLNVAMLGYFKYANFFVEQVNTLFSWWGIGQISWLSVALPAGVSFYTFEKISYLVDVYRRIVPPAKSLSRYLLFVSFFPHLIAGPILRYAEISKQIEQRTHSYGLFFDGFCLLCVGLARKVLIADELGAVADNIIGLPSDQLSVWYAWIGIVLYSLQIYFDFSGYSDMAIGLARMFGFHFMENFNHPYIASSITDFWRRWHISFSKWMRDYLYIPMGGNRCSTARKYFNLVTCFLLSGFWHGASWNFVLWGGFHGVFLILDRLFLLRWLERWPRVLAILFTFFLVTVSRVFFRIETFDAAIAYYATLFGFGPQVSWVPPLEMVCNGRAVFITGIALLLSFVTPFFFKFENQQRFVKALCALVLFVASVLTLTSTKFSPFLYYQF